MASCAPKSLSSASSIIAGEGRGFAQRATSARRVLRDGPNFPVLVVHRVVPAKLATRKSDGAPHPRWPCGAALTDSYGPVTALTANVCAICATSPDG